jgi:exodeoxyribonuclease VII small subunit
MEKPITKKPINEMSFEEAVKRLDETVKRLEKGESTLADSLLLFSQGVELAARCNKLLDEAELKISKLAADETGVLQSVPFEAAGKED